MTNKRIPRLKFGTPIWVEWIDIIQDAGWEQKSDKLKCPVLLAMGFYVSSDKDHLIMCMNIAQDSNDPEISCRQSIPVGTIKEISRIKLEKVTSNGKSKKKS